MFEDLLPPSPKMMGGCFRRRRYVCHQTWSDIPLATGDEVIEFWKVKVKGQGRWGRYAL